MSLRYRRNGNWDRQLELWKIVSFDPRRPVPIVKTLFVIPYLWEVIRSEQILRPSDIFQRTISSVVPIVESRVFYQL